MSDQLVAETATYTTYKKHKRKTPSAGFEPAFPAIKRPQIICLSPQGRWVRQNQVQGTKKNQLIHCIIQNVTLIDLNSTPSMFSDLSVHSHNEPNKVTDTKRYSFLLLSIRKLCETYSRKWVHSAFVCDTRRMFWW